MAYRDIAVFLDPTPESDDRIRLAIELAIRHDARLLGVDVTPRSAYEAGSPEHSRAQSLPDIFHDLTSASACRAEYAVAEPERANWMDFYAHYVDLVVMSKQSPETRHLVPASIPEDVLLSSGVPCLILPSMWTRSAVGTNVVIAWSASREAIRAVHDAMPILQAASKVTLFCADPKSDGEHSDPSLIAGHLLRHGVDAKVDTWGLSTNMSAVTSLFACLDTQEADLIVAGAYGHSRFVEGLFGGTTKELLQEPVLPLLMSH